MTIQITFKDNVGYASPAAFVMSDGEDLTVEFDFSAVTPKYGVIYIDAKLNGTKKTFSMEGTSSLTLPADFFEKGGAGNLELLLSQWNAKRTTEYNRGKYSIELIEVKETDSDGFSATALYSALKKQMQEVVDDNAKMRQELATQDEKLTTTETSLKAKMDAMSKEFSEALTEMDELIKALNSRVGGY